MIIKLQFISNESGDVKNKLKNKQTTTATNKQSTYSAVPGVTENPLFLEDISLAIEFSKHF